MRSIRRSKRVNLDTRNLDLRFGLVIVDEPILGESGEMKRIFLGFLIASLTAGLSMGFPPAFADSSVTKLSVVANGANETPNKGSTTGSASGVFVIDTVKSTICFLKMKSKGLSHVIGAHIHLGATGIDGSIFVSYDIAKFNQKGTTCLKADHLVLLDIAKYPTDYYFNVHTNDFPGGAVRGQLKKVS